MSSFERVETYRPEILELVQLRHEVVLLKKERDELTQENNQMRATQRQHNAQVTQFRHHNKLLREGLQGLLKEMDRRGIKANCMGTARRYLRSA